MNTHRLFVILSASILLLAGCQKEDRIVPDTSNPFYGIYSPSGQINEVSTTSETLLTTQWIGRRLMNVSLANPYEAGELIINQYNYDSHNRLASVDSNIFYTYNGDKLLASIKIIFNDKTRTLMFRYDGKLLPHMVVDSNFYRTYSDINEWYSTSTVYNLEWDKGNLVKATPIDENGVRYEYTYDDNHNPFCGLALYPILAQDNLLQFPSFLSRNNILDVIGYNHDGDIEYYCHYGYELYNTWPQVIYKSEGLNNNSPQTYNIDYL